VLVLWVFGGELVVGWCGLVLSGGGGVCYFRLLLRFLPSMKTAPGNAKRICLGTTFPSSGKLFLETDSLVAIKPR